MGVEKRQVMNILFITSTRIGDAVLSTGLLNYIAQNYLAARVTIVCGSLPSSLFEGYPNLDELIVLKKQKHHKHWWDLWKRVVGTRWDMVIDLRDSAVSRLIRAKQRYIHSGTADKGRHKVEQMADLLELPEVPAPHLWFTAEQKDKAEILIPQGVTPVLAVGPTANWIGKTWPAERFMEVIRAVTAPGGLLPAARVAVFAAPGEAAAAYQVLQSVPESRRIDVIAKTDPGTAAAALARCDFFIGNDSGLMHCAAAARVSTLGLFGPSYDAWYRPWGEHCAFVRTPESFDELIDFEGYDPKTLNHSLMTSLSVPQVMAALARFKV